MNAKEIGVNPEQYLEAIDRMPERTQKEIEAAFHILQTAVMSYVSSKYNDHFKSIHLEQFSTGIRETEDLIKKISDCNGVLQNIQKRQTIVAINASIEAARVGQAGKGFAVVASEISSLAENSRQTAGNIQVISNEVTEAVNRLAKNAQDALDFINGTVLSDYDEFVSTGEKYEHTADIMDEMLHEFDNKAENLNSIMTEMVESVKMITDSIKESSIAISSSAENSSMPKPRSRRFSA